MNNSSDSFVSPGQSMVAQLDSTVVPVPLVILRLENVNRTQALTSMMSSDGLLLLSNAVADASDGRPAFSHLFIPADSTFEYSVFRSAYDPPKSIATFQIIKPTANFESIGSRHISS